MLPPVKRTNYERIKMVFVSRILKETAIKIRSAQRKVVSEWNLFDEGHLQRMLQGHFSVGQLGGGAKLSMQYLAYARFLDMVDRRRQYKRDGYHLYNKIVFGILYGYTIHEIKHDFTEDVAKTIQQEIMEAIEENPMLGAIALKKLRK